MGRHSTIDTEKMVSYVEATLSSIKEGDPIPTRTQLLLEFSPALRTNHATARLRNVRPDLYARILHLEQAAFAAARMEIAAVIQRMGRDERKALNEFAAIGRRYGLGPYTVRRMRAEARGAASSRSFWDWPKVQKFLLRIVQAKDASLTSVGDLACRIGPMYARKGIGLSRVAPMSRNTFVCRVRDFYPDLYKSLLSLAAKNRVRCKQLKKETP